MIVSLTTVASQPHAPVQLGLSVVRTTLASPCGSGDSALPGTAYRVAMRNPPRFPDGGLPGTESTRLEGLRPTVLRTDKAVRVREDAWRRSRPPDGYFQYPAQWITLMPQDAIRKLVDGYHLTREEAAAAVSAVMDGLATPAQIGALLIALRMRGETVDEVAGFAEGMRARVVPVRPKRAPLLDTCGTGGNTFRVFNVSTAAAFVAAAAGIPVAKHGNRAMSGVCG